MQGPRHHFLARPVLAEHQDRRARRGDLANEGEGGIRRR
jgi:hypothetical protein